jgi:hypothetical protein
VAFPGPEQSCGASCEKAIEAIGKRGLAFLMIPLFIDPSPDFKVGEAVGKERERQESVIQRVRILSSKQNFPSLSLRPLRPLREVLVLVWLRLAALRNLRIFLFLESEVEAPAPFGLTVSRPYRKVCA